MSVKLRLRRMGRKGLPVYALVASDARSPRDGKYIEDLGRYEPVAQPARVSLNADRVLYWLGQGAQPTDTAKSLLSREGLMLRFSLERKGRSADEVEQAVSDFRTRRAGVAPAATTAADRRRQQLEQERRQAAEAARQAAEERRAREAELERQRQEAEAAERAARAEADRQAAEAAAAPAADADADTGADTGSEGESATADAPATGGAGERAVGGEQPDGAPAAETPDAEVGAASETTADPDRAPAEG